MSSANKRHLLYPISSTMSFINKMKKLPKITVLWYARLDSNGSRKTFIDLHVLSPVVKILSIPTILYPSIELEAASRPMIPRLCSLSIKTRSKAFLNTVQMLCRVHISFLHYSACCVFPVSCVSAN